jgi:hypothetical protein
MLVSLVSWIGRLPPGALFLERSAVYAASMDEPSFHPEMVKNEWECIRTGQESPYTTDHTVQTFLQESTLNLQESTLNSTTTGKRLSVDLACSSGSEWPRTEQVCP